MASLDIQPEELINNLSQQIGALISENTALKMALQKQGEQIMSLESQIASLPQESLEEETPPSKKK
jgi:regulator of replication initiation timing